MLLYLLVILVWDTADPFHFPLCYTAGSDMKRIILGLLTWLIVVHFLATVVDLGILVVICSDCVIRKG